MKTSHAYSAIEITPAYSVEANLVRHALLDRGLETPLITDKQDRDTKYQSIKQSFTDIATTLGLDLSDDSLCETPHRIAKMYVDEIFAGLDYANFPKITVIENKMGVDEMINILSPSMVPPGLLISPKTKSSGFQKLTGLFAFSPSVHRCRNV